MVKARQVEMWNTSPTMLFGISPKITFKCGSCGNVSAQRINVSNIKYGKELHALCQNCNEVNVLGVRR